jgi:hypothetical protein
VTPAHHATKAIWLPLFSLILETPQLGYAQVSDTDVTQSQPASIFAWQPQTYVIVALFGMVVIVVIAQSILLFTARDRITGNDVIRAFSMPLIIVTLVSLVGIGYSNKQLQPVYGLIGTLIGYLLGRGDAPGMPRPRERAKSKDTSETSEEQP